MKALTKRLMCIQSGLCGTAILALSSTLSYAIEHKCQSQLIQKPDALYQDNLDGSVTDTQTGLIWQKCSLGYQWNANKELDPFDDSCDLKRVKKKQPQQITRFNWQSAQVAIETLNAEKSLANDHVPVWRLPEAEELMTLTDSACLNPAINAHVFPSTQNTLYWTATELDTDTVQEDSAYLVFFSHASQISLSKEREYAVRLVKTAAVEEVSVASDVDATVSLETVVQ